MEDWIVPALQRFSNDTAALAQLRRGLGKNYDECVEIWQYITPMGNSNAKQENALFYTFTLFAMHQQGQTKLVHQEGSDLGVACRNLTLDERSSQSLKNRFLNTARSDSQDELIQHLQGLISILRSKDIPLDYKDLYYAIYYWDDSLKRARKRRIWAHHFYLIPSVK